MKRQPDHRPHHAQVPWSWTTSRRAISRRAAEIANSPLYRKWFYTDKGCVTQGSSASNQPLILIVDDEPGLRFLLQNRLEKKGFLVDVATDGDNAWSKLSGGFCADMVISDMKMPGMDGVQLLRQVRQKSARKDLPFLLMTGFPEKSAETEAKDLGCLEIFIKPFSYTTLVSRIEHYFADQRLRGA
jgi:two-component system response regulator (stage 0 sporulation protein F)